MAAYLNDATDANRTKILVDLFHHYEDEMEYEFNKDYEMSPGGELVLDMMKNMQSYTRNVKKS